MTTGNEHTSQSSMAFPWESEVRAATRIDLHSTRGRLVSAAIEVFRDNGYEGAKVSDIARRSGLTTGAIYSTFGSKDALLSHAAWVASGKTIDEPLYDAVGAPEGVLERIEMVMGNILHAPNRELHVESMLATRRSQGFADLMVPQGQARAQRLVSLLTEAQSACEIRADLEVNALALFLLSVLSGVALLAIGKTIECEESEWRAVIQATLDSLKPQHTNTD